MRGLAVHLLGEFEVDGVPAGRLGSRKARSLLHLLALGRGRPVPDDVLLDELWADKRPAHPGEALSVLVSRLRSVLGAERIVRQDRSYQLHYDRLDVDDVQSLTEELREPDPDDPGTLLAATTLHRLAFADLPGGVVTPWALDRVAEIERILARGRWVATAALLACDRIGDAVDAAAATLARDPLDELGARQLMTALARAGRTAAALREYDALRRRLADELGADPASATQDLYAALLRGDVPLAMRPRARAHQSAIGRAAELARLDRIAGQSRRRGRVRVARIDGEPGIGKSMLLEAFARHRAVAGDVVLLARCSPVDAAVPLDAVTVALAEYLRGPGRTSIEPTDIGPGILDEIVGTASPVTGRPSADRPLLADGAGGPALLFAGLSRVLAALAGTDRPGDQDPGRGPGHLVLLIDDAPLGGDVLADFLAYLARRAIPLLVIATARSGDGAGISAEDVLDLGPLDRADAAALVGADRVDELYPRTNGHPLLLAELAAAGGAGGDEALPQSLLEAVTARCAALGPRVAEVLRTAAVLGPVADPELLAGLLGRPVVDVLDDLEAARSRRILVDVGASLQFRHELIRESLSAGAGRTRAAALNREAARRLAARSAADPIVIARHARAGGDRPLAAHWLVAAARGATGRYDYATAERLLDDAVRLADRPEPALLERAQVRILRHRPLAAIDAAGSEGAPAQEVRAWAYYFARRFDDAVRAADEGVAGTADDPAASALRARCLMVGGRTQHAVGELSAAEAKLIEAVDTSSGGDRLAAQAWLGVLRAHQSRVAYALALLEPAARGRGGIAHTAAMLHALLFTGHAHALAGRPHEALAALDAYTREVARRQVPRFAGRGINFSGWVLRNIGAVSQGVDAHHTALESADRAATPEVRVAALLDLAESRLGDGDLDGAATRLDEARAGLDMPLVFGWRLAFKAAMVRGRLQLSGGAAENAGGTANELARTAHAIGVPRYASVARLLGFRARLAQGGSVDPAAVIEAVDAADASVAIESWHWTGELGAALRRDDLLDRAALGVRRLLGHAGDLAPVLARHAGRLDDRWRRYRTAQPE